MWPLEGTHTPAFWASTSFCSAPLAPGSSGRLLGFGGFFACFLASFPFQSERLCRESSVLTPTPFNERACSKPLCSELGFQVTLGLGMVQNRRHRWDMAAELCSPHAVEELRPISTAGKHPASAADQIPPTSHEKSMEASPSIPEEGNSIRSGFSGC